MKRIMYATSILLLTVRASALNGQEPASRVLTLGEAVSRTIAAHPALDAANAAVARAHSGVRDAESSRKPGVSIDASAVRFQKPMVVAPLHGLDLTNPPEFDKLLLQGSMTAAYTLFDAGARGARIDRAEALEDAATEGVGAARQTLAAQTATAYTTILATREVVRAHDARVSAMQAERARAARLFDEGKVARIIVLRADAALSGARADGVAADAQRETAERELARLMGVDAATIASSQLADIRTTSDMVDRATVLATALKSNPELRRLEAQRAAALQSRIEARSVRLPKIQLGARLMEFASPSGSASTEWQGGAQLSYPVFTGGTTSAASQRAAAEVSAADAEIALARLRIADAIDRAVAALETARSRYTALNDAIAQQLEVARIEKLSLDSGAGIQNDYLTAEAELFRLRAAAAQARMSALQARVELARLAGELTPEWLNTNLERVP